MFPCWENVKQQKTCVIQICILLNCVWMWPDRLNCVVVCIVLIKARWFSHFLSSLFSFLLLLWDDDELWQPDVCVCLLCAHPHTTHTHTDQNKDRMLQSPSFLVVRPSLKFSNLFISLVPTNLSFSFRCVLLPPSHPPSHLIFFSLFLGWSIGNSLEAGWKETESQMFLVYFHFLHLSYSVLQLQVMIPYIFN